MKAIVEQSAEATMPPMYMISSKCVSSDLTHAPPLQTDLTTLPMVTSTSTWGFAVSGSILVPVFRLMTVNIVSASPPDDAHEAAMEYRGATGWGL